MSENTIGTQPAPPRETATLTDTRGRRILIRAVSAREQFKMMKFIGGTNQTYMGMAVMAASVQQIDDMPMPGGLSEAAIETTFGLLGDDGWAAVQNHYASLAPKADDNSDAVMADAKN